MKKHCILFFLCALVNVSAFAQALSANFSADKTGGCSPIVVNFTDLSQGNPTSWSWDFGNGATSTKKNPSTTYFTPGTYTVTLTVSNGNGSNTVTKTNFITVYDQPTADFDASNKTGCTPTVVKFSDKSFSPPGTNIVSWKWDFGDGNTSNQQNPTNVYRTAGSYTVILTITNDKGCSKVITKPNFINPSPGVVASFNYTDPAVCSAPSSVNFTNNSNGPATLSYLWKFGNGSTATSYNASTTYAKNGAYTIQLFVSSTAGCDDSTSQTIQIGKVNTDFIVPNKICPKTNVQFLNNSNPKPISAYWIFSNGTTDTYNNGSTVFATPGTYTVTLVNTYTVCTDTLRKTITVDNAPTVDFKASDTAKCQPPFTVNFTNNSSGNSYVWDFGDNSGTSTQANPSHTYTNYGNYTVSLIATNGCSDTLRKTNYIKISKPVISFKDLPAGGCIPFPFTFTANIQSPDTVTSYKWDFGDNAGTSTQANPTYTYTKQGTYAVTLTITTKGGCTETYTLPDAIKVGSQPIPDFTSDVTKACADPGIQFTNLSTNATEYLWQFSDGSTETVKDPRHRFTDTGWISVTLTAINNGCKNSITKKNYAYIQPSISKFDYQPDCVNKLQYTFTDKSILATSWKWDFGDGTTFIGPNPPTHFFPTQGTYNVSLTTSNGSCNYTLTRTIVIADYTPDFTSPSVEGCKPFATSFTTTIPNPGMFKNAVWDFGDGSAPVDFGQMQSAQYMYVKPGSYDVTLMAIDTFGCKHTITKKSYINVNGAVANFNSLQPSGCKGLTVTFDDSTKTDGIHPITNWKWDFGDGTVQSYTAPPFQHRYDSIGNYDVKLVVTDSKGCSDSILKREFVNISILKAGFSVADASCPNAPVYFADTTKSDLPFSSIWDFGDKQKDFTKSPSHAYTDTGYYSVTLYVKDILGCQDSVTHTNAVHVSVPVASFTANNFTSFCPPFQAIFTNTSTFYNSSFWDLSIGTSNQANPSIYYTNPGTYPIKLVITSPGGCKDSVTHTVSVYDPKSAPFTYNPTNGCRPLNVDFSAFAQMNARFVWDFGDGEVIDTTINQIAHVYDNMGTFVPKIILMEPGGCIIPLTGSNDIDIFGVKAKFNVANRFFCDSGYVSLIDSTVSRDPITKYTWNFGDGVTSNNIKPNHQYKQPGFYTISLIAETAKGCADTAVLKQPIKIVASPLIGINGDSVICAYDKIDFLGVFNRVDTSQVQWKWQFPNGNNSILQNPNTQQFIKPGMYSIQAIATNSSGCADTVTQSLLVHALPTITIASPITKLVGIPLTISPVYSSGIVNYIWSPAKDLSCIDCPQTVTTTKFSTNYNIAVVDSNGCKKDTNVYVHVLCQGSTVFVPNTFSPNGDGSNDIFYVRGKGLDRVKSLRIFNRWGQLVFEQKDLPVNDPNYGWDGRYKGNKPQSDVYVYQLEVFCENGELLRFDGNISLIQ